MVWITQPQLRKWHLFTAGAYVAECGLKLEPGQPLHTPSDDANGEPGPEKCVKCKKIFDRRK